MHDKKPLVFNTRKLNDAQKNCTKGEQNPLGIVEKLKKFEHVLLG